MFSSVSSLLRGGGNGTSVFAEEGGRDVLGRKKPGGRIFKYKHKHRKHVDKDCEEGRGEGHGSGHKSWHGRGRDCPPVSEDDGLDTAIIPVVLDYPYCADQYIIYSRKASILKKGAVAAGGDIGSARYVEVGEDAQVWGSVISDTNVRLLRGSLVNGLAVAGGRVFREEDTEVASQLIENMQGLDECEIPRINEIPQGRKNVLVRRGQEKSLSPGAYRNLRARSLSTLRLRSGTYYFQEFHLDSLAAVVMDLDEGPIQVYVQKSIRIGIEAEIARVSGDSNKVITFYSNQKHPLRIASLAGVDGMFVAPEASIILGDSVELDGRLFGKKVIVSRGSRLYMPPEPDTVEIIPPPVIPVISDSAEYFDSLLQTVTEDQRSRAWSFAKSPDYGAIGDGERQFAQIMNMNWYGVYGNHVNGTVIASLSGSADPPDGVNVLRKVGTFEVRNDRFGYGPDKFGDDLIDFALARAWWRVWPFRGCWITERVVCGFDYRRWRWRRCTVRVPGLCLRPGPSFRWHRPQAAAMAAVDREQIFDAVRRDALAGRPGRTVWEIGNEPNLFPYILPQDYAALFTEYYKVIKEADPNAVITVGSMFDIDFVKSDARQALNDLGNVAIFYAGSATAIATSLLIPPFGAILAPFTTTIVVLVLDDVRDAIRDQLFRYSTRQYFALVLNSLPMNVEVNNISIPLLPDAISLHYYPFDTEARYTRGQIMTRISNASAWLSTDLYNNRGLSAPIIVTEAGNINWEMDDEDNTIQRMIDILDGAESTPVNLGTNMNFNVVLLWYKPLRFDEKFNQLSDVPFIGFDNPPFSRFINDADFDATRAQNEINNDGWAFFCFDLNGLGREYFRRVNGVDCEGSAP